MTRQTLRIVAMAIFTFAPSAYAADKTQLQMMAEIRQLHQQQQELQQALLTLNDTLKSVIGKIDDQAGVVRKSFADQKLLIDSVSETVRILREKADDTNVRLSSMTQELEAMRSTVAAIPAQMQPQPGAVPSTPVTDPGAPPTAPPVTTAPPPGVSPGRMFDEAFADYTRGDYELAIEGFQTYIRMFPRTDRTDDAQLKIGDSLHAAGKYREAIAAFQKVITDYPQTDSVSAAFYKMGVTYEALKQPDLARRAFETVLKNHASSNEAILAKQRLDVLNRR
jgi:tol-pal system protein YbgF